MRWSLSIIVPMCFRLWDFMHSLNALNQRTFYLCDFGLLGVFSASVVEGNVEAPEFLRLPERGFAHGVSSILPNPDLSSGQVCGFLLLVFNSCLALESNHTVFVEMKKENLYNRTSRRM